MSVFSTVEQLIVCVVRQSYTSSGYNVSTVEVDDSCISILANDLMGEYWRFQCQVRRVTYLKGQRCGHVEASGQLDNWHREADRPTITVVVKTRGIITG
jgi:hypothetical protein